MTPLFVELRSTKHDLLGQAHIPAVPVPGSIVEVAGNIFEVLPEPARWKYCSAKTDGPGGEKLPTPAWVVVIVVREVAPQKASTTVPEPANKLPEQNAAPLISPEQCEIESGDKEKTKCTSLSNAPMKRQKQRRPELAA